MKKKLLPIKIVLISLGCLLGTIVLAFLLLMYILPIFEIGPTGKVEGTNDWMKDLDDNMKISEVVLPGSHDTTAINTDLAYFSRCQHLSVKKQLNAGFRYLDIRLDLSEGDKINLKHGFINCRKYNIPFSTLLYLEDVLKECYLFLDENPTEGIVFVCKIESDNDVVSKIQLILDEMIKENNQYWLLTDNIPTVGELRGKMLLCHRYYNEAELDNDGMMFRWREQSKENTIDNNQHIEANHYNENFTLYIQDRFKYDTEDKWNAFVKGINYQVEEANSIKINFLSTNGTPTYGHPYKYAKVLNKRLIDSDLNLNGWVIVDFCSEKLAYRIYSENFK